MELVGKIFFGILHSLFPHLKFGEFPKLVNNLHPAVGGVLETIAVCTSTIAASTRKTTSGEPVQVERGLS